MSHEMHESCITLYIRAQMSRGLEVQDFIQVFYTLIRLTRTKKQPGCLIIKDHDPVDINEPSI